MSRRMLGLAIAAAAIVAAAGTTATAATSDSFQVRTAQDLVDLCAVQRTDPLAPQAIHFCQGYMIGAYHYHQALTSGRGQPPVFCPAGQLPTRDQAVGLYVTWARANPQHMQEPAIDNLVRWAVESWPCPRPNRRARR